MISISVIENNARHLQIITGHIEQHPQYRLVSTATNGFEFVQFCYSNKLLPDIALVDIEMNVMDGVTLIDYLTEYYPSIKCIAVTSHDHKEMVEDMMGCRAMGVVFKYFTIDEKYAKPADCDLTHKFELLDESIVAAMNDEFYLDSKFINTSFNKGINVLNRYTLLAAYQHQKLSNAAFGLTKRETEVVVLYAGTTAKLEDIANLLSMSVHNLKLILTGIYKKMGVGDRSTLTYLCQRKGIVKHARNIVGVEKR